MTLRPTFYSYRLKIAVERSILETKIDAQFTAIQDRQPNCNSYLTLVLMYLFEIINFILKTILNWTNLYPKSRSKSISPNTITANQASAINV